VHGVSFTGGTLAGAEVGAAASRRFARLSLELGGKNATVVFDDADVDRAAAGAARAAFLNTGQICLCGSRVFVQRGVWKRFTDAFVARVAALRQGDPADDGVEVGALISAAHRDKVLRYVAWACEDGGRVLLGGTAHAPADRCAGGFFVQPTVLDGLTPSARTASEEVFGPVVTIHPFDTEDEPVAWTQAGRYGLAASIWTSDLGRAHRVAGAIRAGVVWVNCWLKRDLRTPFGGIGDSGVGREGGAWSLDFYSETRNVCVDVAP
jgi:aminomuconate-semialdehyde/2-hydroxymuconate-6-semialdehyde dehydrogenase